TLAGQDRLPLKLLERQLHISQPTVAGLIRRLEEKEMIRLVTDPADRRSKLACITDKGRAMEEDAKENMLETRTRLLSGMTETEQQILHSLLAKAYTSVRRSK
ncbi:MarR family winged helix-turn-helix transcriptional regulator, partial [Lactobacillus nasalidis]